jgi:ABC-type transport system involved in multi-copper enzyme maturation permease subunit
MPPLVATILAGAGLVLVQLLAALPWVAVVFLGPDEIPLFFRSLRKPKNLAIWVGGALALSVIIGGIWMTGLERSVLEITGWLYGAVLQLQLTIDAFILLFVVLLKVWPKGGAVALAAFREGVRQPMYWLLFGGAFLFMTIMPFIPYFTFGEDHLMVKELGYDTIMFVGAVFAVLAASMFVGDEIEGRTAITLMSKPVSRRQFLLGKFVGILVAAALLFGLLGIWFEVVLLHKHWFDKLDPMATPSWVLATLGKLRLPAASTEALRGAMRWTGHTLDTLPGLILSFSLVMILVALSVTLATRLPMVVNVCVVIAVYVLANLSPVLVNIGEKAKARQPGAVAQILSFLAQLFNTILPALPNFRVEAAVNSDTPLPVAEFWAYVGSASLYGLMYTGILLLFGLILFEDRDLA